MHGAVRASAGLELPAPTAPRDTIAFMKRSLAWLAGIVGIAALGRMLSRRKASATPVEPSAPPAPAADEIDLDPAADPAEELRRKLAAARQPGAPSGARGRRDARGAPRARAREGARSDGRNERRGPGSMTATEQTAHGREPDAELTDVVRELSDQVEALRADVRRLGGPGLPAPEPGWSDETDVSTATPSYAWVSSVGAPVRRRPAVPRLLLEVLFLIGVATAAAIAELDAPVIAGVMAASWALVALIEWAASRAARTRDAIPTLRASSSRRGARGRPGVVRSPRRAHAARAGTRLPNGRDEAAARAGRSRSDRRAPSRARARTPPARPRRGCGRGAFLAAGSRSAGTGAPRPCRHRRALLRSPAASAPPRARSR